MNLGRRIVVVGTGGKTTLARELARRLAFRHVELDSLFWGPEWTQVPDEVFVHRIQAELEPDGWVVDGNYRRISKDLVWPRAETVVWLDYSLPLVLRRIAWRTVRRSVLRVELWSGNREKLRSLVERDGLLNWLLTTHRSRRASYAAIFSAPDRPNSLVVRLRTPRATRRWLRAVEPG